MGLRRRRSCAPTFYEVAKWHNQEVWITQVLSGEYVGLVEVDDGIWNVEFGAMLLGRFNHQTQKLQPLGAPQPVFREEV